MSDTATSRERWTARAIRLALILAVALAWEMSARWRWVDPDLMPSLTRIFQMTGRLLQDRGFRADLWVTAAECLVAFAIVAPLGLITGFALGESPRLYRAFSPALQLAMTTPKSIFLPVFILLFGIGFSQKVIFAVVLSYFLVVPTGVAAVQSVPSGLVGMARAFGATRSQIFARLYLPSAMPLVLSGVRLGLIFSMHGIIFAEMYASSEGVGRSILTWGEAFEMERLFAAVLLVVAATIALNESFQALENIARRRAAAGASA